MKFPILHAQVLSAANIFSVGQLYPISSKFYEAANSIVGPPYDWNFENEEDLKICYMIIVDLQRFIHGLIAIHCLDLNIHRWRKWLLVSLLNEIRPVLDFLCVNLMGY